MLMSGARSYTPYIGIDYLSPLYQRILSLLELQVLVYALAHSSPTPVHTPLTYNIRICCAAPLAFRATRAAAHRSADERRGTRVGRAARVRHFSSGLYPYAPAARIRRALLANGECTPGGGAARAVARLESPAGVPCALSSRLASETETMLVCSARTCRSARARCRS